MTMNYIKFIWRSLVFYRRTHIGVVLGVALCCTVLVGALVIGDSVRLSLLDMALQRLGRTHLALEAHERFFGADLAQRLENRTGVLTAPICRVMGMAGSDDGERKTPQVHILGIPPDFFKHFAPEKIENAMLNGLSENEALINRRLADKLEMKAGDTMILRMEKPKLMPYDAPLANTRDATQAMRVKVKAVVHDRMLGNFNLRASQIPPYNVFLNRTGLCAELNLTGKANMLLTALPANENEPNPDAMHQFDRALRESLDLEDAALELRKTPDQPTWELRSRRIFLEPTAARAGLSSPHAHGVFSYFVNSFRSGDRLSPYAVATAAGAPWTPADMADDEIVITDWLAKDLGGVHTGDPLHLHYYVVGPLKKIEKRQALFKVHKIVPIQNIYADPALMPPFPGIDTEDDCSDWDPGIPLDMKLIRDKDETYWDDHRGTPKAYITLKKGQELWGNRFGQYTAIRYAGDDLNATNLTAAVMNRLTPTDFGLFFRNVRQEGIAAGLGADYFGSLFIGLSFFLIVAALILTGLLVGFGIEQRLSETGLLLAVGFQRQTVRWLHMAEAAVLTLIGGIIGCLGGLAYTRLVLNALSTVWRGSVATAAIQAHVLPTTLTVGTFIGMATALLTMWGITGKHAKDSVAARQRGMTDATASGARNKNGMAFFNTGYVLVILALLIMGFNDIESGKGVAGAYFAVGALLLTAGIVFFRFALFKLDLARGQRPEAMQLGLRNATRGPGRSLATAGVLACGVFLTLSVGLNRHDPTYRARERSSGTGGFALFGQTSMPLLHNLNTEQGRKTYRLNKLEDVEFVPLALREGDNASCMNLNRITFPALLGVDPQTFDQRDAFTFAWTTSEVDPEHPWLVLDQELDNNVAPVIADATVIQYILQLGHGAVITNMTETGKTFKLKLVGGLANSIFQGYVLIGANHFHRLFPSISGSHVLLVDAPEAQMEAAAKELNRGLRDLGLDLMPCAERLAAFSVVERTYLRIFLALGGLALIFGSMGLGIVVLRNIMERRGELAILQAVGYSRKQLITYLMSEHVLLLLTGLVCGLVAAIAAVMPVLAQPGASVPYGATTVMLCILLGSGLLWIGMASAAGVKKTFLPTLRNE